MMKPKTRVILEMAIEEGVRRGYSRAHKHVENPTEGAIIEHIEEAVMSQIYEYFSFDEEEGG
jgi:archaeosine-15-forming tRNA-guanine transglycosylase